MAQKKNRNGLRVSSPGQVGDGVYSNPYREPDFYDIKGLVEGILEVCGIVDYTLEKTDAPTLPPRSQRSGCCRVTNR